MRQGFELRHGQSLRMTPALQLAIKMHELSNLELEDSVEKLLEANPFLKLAEGTKQFTPGPSDSGWSSVRPSNMHRSIGSEGDLIAALPRQATLAEHLTCQLHQQCRGATDRIVGEYFIGMLDERGYLSAGTSEVAKELAVAEASVSRILAILQTFDPPGVFARDFKECWCLQLAEVNCLNPAMRSLIANVEMLAKLDGREKLSRICGVSAEELAGMVLMLQRLDRRPGDAFRIEPLQPKIPDVIVRAAQDGSWLVELNSDTLPRLLIDREYLAMVGGKGVKKSDRIFVKELYADARNLVKALDIRAKNILSVAAAIVRRQDAFLLHGVQYLRPCRRQDIAAELDLSESTVSRVVSNKYIATPGGVLPMSFFFPTSIASSLPDGNSHSAEAVRAAIKNLIAREGRDALSDASLVMRLAEVGIVMVRRTVAKYRDSLNIPSAARRRRSALGVSKAAAMKQQWHGSLENGTR